MGFMGLHWKSEVEELRHKISRLVEENEELDRMKRHYLLETIELRQRLLREMKTNINTISRGVKGSEAEEAFEPFRKDVAKRIVTTDLTTENALMIARRAFISGFKKARE